MQIIKSDLKIEYKIDEKPLISVIIACYNIAEYIGRCLDSVLAQTYENLEIIVVDDGSTDDSGAICDKYATDDSRIKVIHKENQGLGPARNSGMKIATGEYIAFVDGDDFIEPYMYECMMASIKNYNVQLAVCRYREVCSDDVYKKEKSPIEHDICIMSRDELLYYLIAEDDSYKIQNAAWNKLYHRDLIANLSFPARRYEDIVYTTCAFSMAESGVYIDTALYNYVTDRQGSIMNNSSMDSIMNELLVAYKERDEFLNSRGYNGLVYMHDYMVYKKLLLYYTSVRRGKSRDKKAFLQALESQIDKCRASYDEIYKCPIADSHQKLRMDLFLKSPILYNIFMDLNDYIVLPIRLKIVNRK